MESFPCSVIALPEKLVDVTLHLSGKSHSTNLTSNYVDPEPHAFCKGILFNITIIYYFYRRLSALSSFLSLPSFLSFYSILQWSTGCPLMFNNLPALASWVLGYRCVSSCWVITSKIEKQSTNLRPKKPEKSKCLLGKREQIWQLR